jgi:hypothetical protein
MSVFFLWKVKLEINTLLWAISTFCVWGVGWIFLSLYMQKVSILKSKRGYIVNFDLTISRLFTTKILDQGVSKFTIKILLQAVRGGGKINLKGLYSGLAGNLAGVLP